jgi:uncharacterized membrane protein YGL010W
MIIWTIGKLKVGYFWKVNFYGHTLYEGRKAVLTEDEYNTLLNVIQPEVRRIG